MIMERGYFKGKIEISTSKIASLYYICMNIWSISLPLLYK